MAADDVMALVKKAQVFFLDVREPKELEEFGTFEGYVNIPVGQLEKRLAGHQAEGLPEGEARRLTSGRG